MYLFLSKADEAERRRESDKDMVYGKYTNKKIINEKIKHAHALDGSISGCTSKGKCVV